MSERGALRGLRVLMWVVIAIEVPVYLVWLVQVGYLTGQELPRGDVARWAPPVLLPPAAVLFCVMAGWTWWLSVVADTRSSLRERWIVASRCSSPASRCSAGWPRSTTRGVGGAAERRRDRARHDRAVLHPGRRLPPAARRHPPALPSYVGSGRSGPAVGRPSDCPGRRAAGMLRVPEMKG